jgi:hypothetical protein
MGRPPGPWRHTVLATLLSCGEAALWRDAARRRGLSVSRMIRQAVRALLAAEDGDDEDITSSSAPC